MQQTVKQLLGAAFGSSGQRCMALSVAVIVGNDISGKVISELKKEIKKFKIGNFDQKLNDFGPLVSKEHKKSVIKLIDSAEKDGAKLVNAVSNSVVPKITLVVGGSYGAGNYAMCGKAYDPRLIVGWPTAEIAVMSGAAAAKTLLQIEVSSLKAKGEKITAEKEKELFDKIKNRYDEQISPYYAASRLWIDAIIDPIETRKVISIGIDSANHKKATKAYNVGVLQT